MYITFGDHVNSDNDLKNPMLHDRIGFDVFLTYCPVYEGKREKHRESERRSDSIAVFVGPFFA
jgi:hypothetical protein